MNAIIVDVIIAVVDVEVAIGIRHVKHWVNYPATEKNGHLKELI